MATKSDSFLRDAIHPEKRHQTLTYMDGFRFGFGAVIAILLAALIVGGIAYATINYLHFG